MRKLIKPIGIYRQEDGEAYLVKFKAGNEEECCIGTFLISTILTTDILIRYIV